MTEKKPDRAYSSTPVLSNDALPEVVDMLLEAGDKNALVHTLGHMSLPSRDVISSFVEDMRSVLFPGYFGVSDVTGKSLRFHVGATLDRALLTLKEQINRGLCFACENSFSGHKCVDCERNSSQLAHRFSMRIPHIKTLLKSDVQAVFD
jgi:serine O-acetyltransferase